MKLTKGKLTKGTLMSAVFENHGWHLDPEGILFRVVKIEHETNKEILVRLQRTTQEEIKPSKLFQKLFMQELHELAFEVKDSGKKAAGIIITKKKYPLLYAIAKEWGKR